MKGNILKVDDQRWQWSQEQTVISQSHVENKHAGI